MGQVKTGSRLKSRWPNPTCAVSRAELASLRHTRFVHLHSNRPSDQLSGRTPCRIVIREAWSPWRLSARRLNLLASLRGEPDRNEIREHRAKTLATANTSPDYVLAKISYPAISHRSANFPITLQTTFIRKSPVKSFKYRFYADFARNSFIYRIYVFAPEWRGFSAKPQRSLRLCVIVCRRFFTLVFSHSYELLFPQPLCFANHPSCPGGVGVPFPALATRRWSFAAIP
jgi:hypothetical protein